MTTEQLALILAAVRKATADEVAKIEVDLTRPLRFLEGPQGKPGAPGERGVQGETGPQGPTGDTGARGKGGPPGERGETGPQGPRGVPGERGLPGLDGASVVSALVNDAGELILALDDGRKVNAGRVRGPQGERGPRGPRGPSGAGGGAADAGASLSSGVAVIDFGAAPGASTAEIAITGQDGIAADASVAVWVQGDSTADHNAYEHSRIFPAHLGLSTADVVAGTGFTIIAASELRLTGAVKVRWQWS